LSFEAPHGREVLPVHDQDVIEPDEILRPDLPASALDPDPPGQGDRAAPRVRRITRVISGRPRGIDLEQTIDSALPCLVPEDCLRQGRTTDVAEADEEDSDATPSHS